MSKTNTEAERLGWFSQQRKKRAGTPYRGIPS